LVVDDDATNRQIVTTLLAHSGYEVHEASDGREGLEVALSVRPQLVISDILMPTMDGYEFVRRLRAHPQLDTVEVVFYTANYHEREAHNLAKACRVARVLAKPSAASDMLEAIKEVLKNGASAQVSAPVGEEFDREHLQVITNKLAEKVNELESSNSRLKALTDLNLQLASERDPRKLVEKVCYSARHLLGAKYAVLVVSERQGASTPVLATSGLIFPGSAGPTIPLLDAQGPLGRVYRERETWRASRGDLDPHFNALPVGYPSANAYLAAPISSLAHTYGWICLADKVGAKEFSIEDERILGTLAAQVGRIYENGILTGEIQLHATQLLVEMDEREQARSNYGKARNCFASWRRLLKTCSLSHLPTTDR
jgi:CheY-like chemotaxis protein